MHAPHQTHNRIRFAVTLCGAIFAGACAGCLDADQGSLVVKPQKSKRAEPSSGRSERTNLRAGTNSRRDDLPDDPDLARELAQVDDLIRSAGGKDADEPFEEISERPKSRAPKKSASAPKKAESTEGSILQTAFFDEPAPEKAGSSKPNSAKSSPRMGKTNRLSKESSPYLLLHAHNPVNWFPWGPEAFERAKQENKLIFLSIGYSSCHWCHVMERLVFSNEAIAKFMNEHFINVKVDREERPDIDDIYMTALTVYFRLSGSSQGGGWPLSLFLTPQGKPIAGGTYFPPDDEAGRMGFPTVMKKVADLWRDESATLEKNADIITAHVQRTMSAKVVLKEVPLTADVAANVVQEIAATHDSKFGGFDFDSSRPNAPKFPVPSKLSLLLYAAARDRDEATLSKVTHTLDAMAAGGIRDHLAGGFHRYSTDRAWKVPHFEKMLYDNAQLIDVYAEAFRLTNNAAYKAIAEETCDFVLREMTDKRGGFFSAIDADSEEVEGKSYVWSEREIDQLLDADTAEAFKRAYGLREKNTFEVGFVLHQPQPLDEVAQQLKLSREELETLLASAKRKLLTARNRRPAPLLDDKILTGWNGLMIKALADASVRLDRADYLAAGERAAMFVLTELRDPQGRLLRSHRAGTSKIAAYLDDYTFLVDGLIALHLATREQKWLNAASRLTDDQLQLFWDDQGHGFFYTATDHEELLARAKDRYDSVVPSGNSVAVRNLLRLAKLTGNKTYREKAEQTLKAFVPSLAESPNGFANLALEAFEFFDQPDFGASRRIRDPNIELASEQEVIDLAIKPKRAGTATGNSSPSSSSAEADKAKKSDILKAEAHLNVDRLPAGSTCRVALVVNINDGWHINQNPPQPDYMLPTRFTMKTKHGTKLAEVKYPKGHKFNLPGFDEALMVYEGQIVLFGTLEVPEMAGGKVEEFELQLRYQACNNDKCEQPKTLKLVGKVEIAPVGEKVKTINDKLFNPPKPQPKKAP